jgi:hypothetical protein
LHGNKNYKNKEIKKQSKKNKNKKKVIHSSQSLTKEVKEWLKIRKEFQFNNDKSNVLKLNNLSILFNQKLTKEDLNESINYLEFEFL